MTLFARKFRHIIVLLLICLLGVLFLPQSVWNRECSVPYVFLAALASPALSLIGNVAHKDATAHSILCV